MGMLLSRFRRKAFSKPATIRLCKHLIELRVTSEAYGIDCFGESAAICSPVCFTKASKPQ